MPIVGVPIFGTTFREETLEAGKLESDASAWLPSSLGCIMLSKKQIAVLSKDLDYKQRCFICGMKRNITLTRLRFE